MRVGLPDYEYSDDLTWEIWKILEPEILLEDSIEYVQPKDWMLNDTEFKRIMTMENYTTDELVTLKYTNIDVLFDVWAITEERLRQALFTTVVLPGDYVFNIPSRRLNHTEKWYFPTRIISVFSMEIWVCLVGIFIVILASSFVIYGNHLTNAWQTFTHTIMQNSQTSISTTARARLLLIAASIFTIHSFVLYQGCLLSTLVRPHPEHPPFRNIADLARLIREGNAKLDFEYRASSIKDLIYNESQPGSYNDLRRALRFNPPLYSMEDPASELSVPENVLIIKLNPAVRFWYTLDPSVCDRLAIRADARYVAAFPVSPKSGDSTLNRLNRAIEKNSDLIGAVYDKFLSKKINQYELCQSEQRELRATQPGESIELNRLAGMFTAWLAGICVAVMVFVVEQFRRTEPRVKV